MMQYRSRFIVALLLSGVGACSTLNYQQPITQFSQGVSDLNAAFNALKVTRDNAAINNLANSLKLQGTFLSLPTGCPITDNPPREAKPGDCSWSIHYPGGNKVAANVKNHEAQSLAFISALDAYGQGLVAISSAQDVAALKAAVAKAGSAISTVSSVAMPGSGTAVNIITTGFAWLFGEIADAERLKTLAAIVEQADPVIQKETSLLQKSAEHLQAEILNDQQYIIYSEMAQVTLLSKSNGSYSDINTAAQNVVNDAIAYDKTASNGIGGALVKMKSSHADLLKSLKKPDINFEDAISTASDFAAQASTLMTIEKGN